MDGAHFHLLLNHLPVFGLIFGTIWLLAALALKQNTLRNAALISLVVVAIGTIPAYMSGESAEEVMENMPGRNGAALEEHEHAAFPALLLTLGAGVLAAASWVMNRSGKLPFLNWLTLAVAVVAIVLMARVGNLGGQISHPEIGGASSAAPAGGAEHDDD